MGLQCTLYASYRSNLERTRLPPRKPKAKVTSPLICVIGSLAALSSLCVTLALDKHQIQEVVYVYCQCSSLVHHRCLVPPPQTAPHNPSIAARHVQFAKTLTPLNDTSDGSTRCNSTASNTNKEALLALLRLNLRSPNNRIRTTHSYPLHSRRTAQAQHILTTPLYPRSLQSVSNGEKDRRA